MMLKLAFCLNAPAHCECHSHQETVKINLDTSHSTTSMYTVKYALEMLMLQPQMQKTFFTYLFMPLFTFVMFFCVVNFLILKDTLQK